MLKSGLFSHSDSRSAFLELDESELASGGWDVVLAFDGFSESLACWQKQDLEWKERIRFGLIPPASADRCEVKVVGVRDTAAVTE